MTAPDIALISPFPPPGERHGGWTGVASYAASLAGALGAAGARVTVLADVVDGAPAVSRSGSLEVRRVWRRGASALPRAAAAAVRTGAPAAHVQHELMLYGGAAAAAGLLPALACLRVARRRAVVTLHHVLDPRAIDAEFTATHHVHAPVPAARAGVAALQRGIAALADTVVVHEPQFAALVPGAQVIPHGIETPAEPPHAATPAASPAAAPAASPAAMPAPSPAATPAASPAATPAASPAASPAATPAAASPAATPAASSRAAARAALGVGDGRLVALCFGFLAPYKGLEVAIAGAREAGDGVRLVLAGGDHPRVGGAYAAALREVAAPGTRFTGFVPDEDVSRWFAAADVALLLYPRPFASSGPLALALAHGTPVLLSPRLAEVTGAPCELSVELDPRALAARLRSLAQRPEERAVLRERAAALGAGRTWPEVARRHLELYA